MSAKPWETQPRQPAGTPIGGEWNTTAGGGAATSLGAFDDGPDRGRTAIPDAEPAAVWRGAPQAGAYVWSSSPRPGEAARWFHVDRVEDRGQQPGQDRYLVYSDGELLGSFPPAVNLSNSPDAAPPGRRSPEEMLRPVEVVDLDSMPPPRRRPAPPAARTISPPDREDDARAELERLKAAARQDPRVRRAAQTSLLVDGGHALVVDGTLSPVEMREAVEMRAPGEGFEFSGFNKVGLAVYRKS